MRNTAKAVGSCPQGTIRAQIDVSHVISIITYKNVYRWSKKYTQGSITTMVACYPKMKLASWQSG